jgi:uncharacterized delta-60 repeat protein
MSRNLIILTILLLLSMPPLAQGIDTTWVRRYNGPGNHTDEAFAIVADDFGNVYVTGYSFDSETDFDYATIKYQPDGDTAWVRRYNGPRNSIDRATAIAVDGYGNVYVTGVTDYEGSSGISADYATIKYYPDGDIAWVRRYNGTGNSLDRATAIAVDDSGNVCVTGYSYGSKTNFDYATIKYYPDGDTAWVRRYNGRIDSIDCAFAIAVDDSGNVYVTGFGTLWEWDCEYITIKYYPNGDTAWVRRYSGAGYDRARAIAVDDSGNVYVTGESHGGAGAYYDYVTIKYHPNGNIAWTSRYNGPGNWYDGARAMALDDSGNVYVTGYSYGGSETDYDYATIKYHPNGDTAWARRYNGPGSYHDEAYDIAVDGSGNVYVTGYSRGSETWDDYVTIKYHPRGDTTWTRRYNGPVNGDDVARTIVIDGSGNVYVSGSSVGSGTGFDYATIKYSKNTNVRDETESREKTCEFSLSQNYPNPFNQTTKIEFTLVTSDFVSLKIYDILGRKVRTLVSEHVPSGHKSVLWDGKDGLGNEVASGIYFYKLEAGDFTEVKKMVLIK